MFTTLSQPHKPQATIHVRILTSKSHTLLDERVVRNFFDPATNLAGVPEALAEIAWDVLVGSGFSLHEDAIVQIVVDIEHGSPSRLHDEFTVSAPPPRAPPPVRPTIFGPSGPAAYARKMFCPSAVMEE